MFGWKLEAWMIFFFWVNFNFFPFFLFERDPTENVLIDLPFSLYLLFLKFIYLLFILINIWSPLFVSLIYLCMFLFLWSLKQFTLLPDLKFTFLFSLVSQHFWWWLHWRSLQAQDVLLFLPFIKVVQKYLAFLTGFVCFQMETPFSLEKH